MPEQGEGDGASTERPPSKVKKWLWRAFKVAATLALLVFAMSRIDFSGLGGMLAQMGPVEVLSATALTLLSIAFLSARWFRLLRGLGERVKYRELVADTFVGTTYNLLLPLAVGGDAVRGVRASRRARSERVWGSIALERIMGFLSLATIPLVGAVFDPSARDPAFVGVMISILVVFFSSLWWIHLPLRWSARWFRGASPSLAGFLQRLADVFRGDLARPMVRLEAFVWSLVYQITALGVLYVVALPWGASNLFSAVFVGVPLVLILSIIPITIGGHGLRESLFVTVLAGFGLLGEQSLALAIVWLLSSLLCALIGLGVMGVEQLRGAR